MLLALGLERPLSAPSGTFLLTVLVPVRAAGFEGREGNAFWHGPQAEAASAAVREDRQLVGASLRRPGLPAASRLSLHPRRRRHR